MSPTGRRRILVVDDDRLVLATVVHGLSQAGYEVLDADNGDDAILLARQHRPQLALLDIRMEGKTGFDVAEYLRDVAHVPFVFLSAFSDEATRAKVAELGAQAYLVKPLDVGQILPTLDAVFDRLSQGGAAAVPPKAAASAIAPTPTPPAAPAAAPAPTPPAALPADEASTTLWLALGILMHRHGLSRGAARRRLQAMAADKGVTEAEQGRRLVAAIEELAGSGEAPGA